ncbi:hypothetical protein FQR65_LT03837 [Abscondita terminalis]|nr:hypothetical protein FQR65_LT03837 [Abscondita terminalis]
MGQEENTNRSTAQPRSKQGDLKSSPITCPKCAKPYLSSSVLRKHLKTCGLDRNDALKIPDCEIMSILAKEKVEAIGGGFVEKMIQSTGLSLDQMRHKRNHLTHKRRQMLPKVIKGLNLYYSLYSPPCRTVLLTLKSLGIQLEPKRMRPMDIHRKFEQFEPWFEQINYEKVVPTIVDNGYVLWESRAISKYLVQKYAQAEKKKLYPTDITDQSRVDRALGFDQGILYRSILDYFKPQLDLKQPPNPLLGAEIERSLQLLEQMLGMKKFLLGGIGGEDVLTIADLSIVASLSKLESMDYSYERYSLLSKYVERFKEHVAAYHECCQEGIDRTKEWNRKNLTYLPGYLSGDKPGNCGASHETNFAKHHESEARVLCFKEYAEARITIIFDDRVI